VEIFLYAPHQWFPPSLLPFRLLVSYYDGSQLDDTYHVCDLISHSPWTILVSDVILVQEFIIIMDSWKNSPHWIARLSDPFAIHRFARLVWHPCAPIFLNLKDSWRYGAPFLSATKNSMFIKDITFTISIHSSCKISATWEIYDNAGSCMICVSHLPSTYDLGRFFILHALFQTTRGRKCTHCFYLWPWWDRERPPFQYL